MKPIINLAFDADDVMFDTEKFIMDNAVDFFKEKYNLNIVDKSGYNVKEIFECAEEQQKEFWTKFVLKYSLFYKPIQNLTETLEKLKNDDRVTYNIHILTSKYKATEPGIGQLVKFLFETGLKKHGIYKYIDKIHYCSLENSAEDKFNICISENISITVEDSAENILKLNDLAKENKLQVICKNTENNKKYDLGESPRANNYNEIYTEIMKTTDKILATKSIFTTFEKLTKEEKNSLSTKELADFYKSYREYIVNLPFNKDKMLKGEEFQNKAYKIIGKQFEKKYNPIVLDKKLIPDEKGLIFISNHQGDKDFLLLLSALENVPWHPLLKIEFLDKFKTRFLLGGVHPIYVDRDVSASRKDSTLEMAKILLNSGNLLIFPEGTYTKSSNNLDFFRGKSPIFLSQALEKYIVPISITQNYNDKERPIVRFNEPLKVGVEEDIDDVALELYNRMDKGIEKNKVLKMELGSRKYIK
ncbi:MAG: lysophospholipid acyltransferase family protein [Bacilli bacterium]|nr:lysophospholipid acyltransferase family protein [Bacilli bacterium]MDD4282722.1 lysophospholipid acyltransferase family protein [Bacilli bacterium]MDD4718396.1 lysophospholipid acyltransferase family protein [Bacilli bacterium]